MNPGGPCYGDSGGPEYFARDGQDYVAGVISYGDDCTSYGVNTSVAAFAGWIEDFIQSGHSEDCANSVDDDGDGLLDCDDEDCQNFAACDSAIEDCRNSIDDDADGQIDSQDSDCSAAPGCVEQDDKKKALLGRGCGCSTQTSLLANLEHALIGLLLLGFAWRRYRKTDCSARGH